ncbi:MAG: HNH endonuclease [Treponema sp.]|nr:HNH endonuclease [Treponema sp.]
MKGRDWGVFFNKYSKNTYDAKTLETRIAELLDDDDVTNNSGIYEFLLSGEEKHLSIRAFTSKMARAAFEKQRGLCPKCGKTFAFEQMQADHITPWSKGGKTVAENCQMLCADCNRRKSNI